MESETVRRNVKKSAAFGGMYVQYTLAKVCNVSGRLVAGQAGDEAGTIRQQLRHTSLPRLPHFSTKTRKPIQASTFSPKLVVTGV
jgi:hypothetical protein